MAQDGSATAISRTLASDCAFLEKNNLMDYSMYLVVEDVSNNPQLNQH